MKDPALPGTRHVDELVGPDSATTMPPATVAAVVDHGALAGTLDRDLPAARDVLARLTGLAIDLDEVSAALETEGVDPFTRACGALSGALAAEGRSTGRTGDRRELNAPYTATQVQAPGGRNSGTNPACS